MEVEEEEEEEEEGNLDEYEEDEEGRKGGEEGKDEMEQEEEEEEEGGEPTPETDPEVLTTPLTNKGIKIHISLSILEISKVITNPSPSPFSLLLVTSSVRLIPTSSIDITKVIRHILHDQPRVTRFLIDWD